MHLIIHRGTQEIGGSCVELKTTNSRILIDFGIPLVSRDHQPFDVNLLKGKTIEELKSQGTLPDIKGLYKDEEKGIDGIQGTKIIYSMWEGYLTDKFRSFCAQKNLTIEHVHTSGHATIEDLKAFANALNPERLVPIHTFEGKQFPALFQNVKVLEDGEVLDL